MAHDSWHQKPFQLTVVKIFFAKNFDVWILSSSRVVLILSMDSTKPTHHVYIEVDAQHSISCFLKTLTSTSICHPSTSQKSKFFENSKKFSRITFFFLKNEILIKKAHFLEKNEILIGDENDK